MQLKTTMIRKFQQSDLDSVINIWLEASIIAHNFIDKKFWKSKVNDMRNTYIPSSETYIYDDGEVKGFISLFNDTIAALFVTPDEQGSGIGTQLIVKSKEARNHLNLSVYKENIRSIEFYKKCGFKVINEQIDERTGHPELVMTFN